ncbi:PREDICTED: RHOMBOID-like protein 9, chloroplastic isoform X2 [Camelina sativa]|uniref:RHOMBOID-like protein 9, chloroplastic isoform X2 n=1 Tax=Camelina sativa TaxID=90675 RepID=A0ABM1QPX3_CAMSA|nr:PREDICTED: RHOMBOID-like protein 9, chloroplastic isoform X2 [Camelina sativa]
MALFPLHHEVPCKGEVLFDSNGLRRFSSGGSSNVLKHRTTAEAATLGRDCRMKSCKKTIPYRYSQRGKLCLVRASSENKVTKKRIQLLDSYFGKLRNEDDKPSISAGDDIDQKVETSAYKELDSLSVYLDKLQKGLVPSTLEVAKSEGGSVASKLRKKTGVESNNNPFQQLDDDDQSEDTLNFYVVSILASINVGVCLFEAAAPVRNNDMGLLSLPLLYGAKINDLIVAGEWWRLVTPMFLVQDQQIGHFHFTLQHSGIAHVALSSWALLTFGPKVCRDYGLITFCLIYILGGVSGNFMSFLHTPDPTVGGTGPAFALIGAWLVDQNQNKEMIKSDEYEDLFQKAIIMTGLGLILSHFGPIDDWTNLGALIAGIVYGFFTCPVLQLGRGSERQEGTVTVGPEKEKNADPCKSFLVFTIFIAVLVTSVLLLGDGPLDFPTYDDVVYSLI